MYVHIRYLFSWRWSYLQLQRQEKRISEASNLALSSVYISLACIRCVSGVPGYACMSSDDSDLTDCDWWLSCHAACLNQKPAPCCLGVPCARGLVPSWSPQQISLNLRLKEDRVNQQGHKPTAKFPASLAALAVLFSLLCTFSRWSRCAPHIVTEACLLRPDGILSYQFSLPSICYKFGVFCTLLYMSIPQGLFHRAIPQAYSRYLAT